MLQSQKELVRVKEELTRKQLEINRMLINQEKNITERAYLISKNNCEDIEMKENILPVQEKRKDTIQGFFLLIFYLHSDLIMCVILIVNDKDVSSLINNSTSNISIKSLGIILFH